MAKDIDEKKLAEAKEKLACKIEPAAFMDASQQASAAQSAASASAAPAAQSGPQADFIDENGKVLLTRMTAAGG